MASDEKLLTLARARLKLVEDADSAQDKREREDLRFYEGEGQWSDEIRTARKGQAATAGLPPVPPRPCITITGKIREPVRHVLNEERDSDLGIEVVPADDFEALTGPIDPTEIELREGLIRRIQRQSEAADARSWAFARAAIAGRGYYGLMTRYVDGPSFDQEIYYRRFYNQAQVKLDPSADMPDGSDAEWAFVGDWMSWERYKAEHGKLSDRARNSLIPFGESDFGSLCDTEPDWFKEEGKGDKKVGYVRVLEYWPVQFVSQALVQLKDGRTIYEDDLEGKDKDQVANRREQMIRQVLFAKLDGKNDAALQKTDWLGRYIPIIKVVGEEIQPFDKQRRCEGIVRPSRDSIQGFNTMVSAEVELFALMPKYSPELDPEQIEGFEEVWNAQTVRNWSYKPRKSYDAMGRPYLPITYPQGEPPMQGAAALVQQFDTFIKSSTGIPDPTLGNVDPSIRSGKGIKALLAQSEKGTSHYQSNLVRSEHYEAKILNDLLYPIYQRPGRIARILNSQGEPSSVILHQPSVMTGTNGSKRPVPFNPQQHQGQQPKTYTLTKDAQFNVAVKVTKSYDTRREEIEATLTELVQADPQATLPFFADLLFKYSDAPGHEEMEQRGKLMLAPQVQQALSGQSPVPPELQAQLQALQAENQQLKSDRQGQIAKTQIQEQAENQRTAAQLQNNLDKAEIAANATVAAAEVKAQNADLDRRLKLIELFLTADKEARLDRETRAHESGQAALKAAHEAGLTALEHGHQKELSAQTHQQTLEASQQTHQQNLEAGATGHAQNLEAQQQAADLAPEPTIQGE